MNRLRLGVLCCLASLSVTTDAHDLSESTGNATWNAARLAFMPTDSLHASNTFDGVPNLVQYVMVLPNKWNNTRALTVCFVGGSEALRTRILSIAKTWLTYTNLTFADPSPGGHSCAATGDASDIRIGFREPGYWSYIGTDSLNPYLVSHNLVSLNLQNFDIVPPSDPRFTGIVLHEFGHALGFHHEHQSPGENCDSEIDWPKLYTWYKTTYNWDQKIVDDNVRELQANRSAYDWSSPDPASIMIYSSDPQFLKSGIASRCYFHENNALSDLDKKGAAVTYPKDSGVLALQLQAATLPVAISAAKSPRLLKALTLQNELVKAQMSKLAAPVR